MNCHTKLCLVLFCTLLAFGAKSQEDNQEIKVISYNIWNGFNWGEDEARRAEVVQWIKSEDPDIVGLQELCKYAPEKLSEDAKGWGHEYSVLLKKTGYSVGLTSKYPIKIIEKIRSGMHHGALHCRINGIDVFVIHLSPSSYLKRREEADILLKKLKETALKNPNYLVMGDFNAHSPFDADLYKNNIARDHTRKSEEDKGENGNLANGEIDYAVISTFLGFPLIDICQRYTTGLAERGSFPARSISEKNNASDRELIDQMVRIDYILVSEELGKNAVSGQVHNGKANWYLSDHYPVSVVFEY